MSAATTRRERGAGTTDPDLLITRYLAGVASAEEVADLTRWIRADGRNARHFAREAFVHRRLADRLRGQMLAAPMLADTPTADTAPTSAWRLPRVTLAVAAVLALATLLALGFWWPSAGAARVVAVLDTPATEVGAVGAGPQSLVSGLVLVRFDSGTTVVVEAPARWRVADGHTLELEAGRVTVRCPTPASQGFRVVTPTMEVVDLGTEFAVAAEPDRVVARVFEGTVELRTAGEREVLRAGAARRLAGDGRLVALGPGEGPAFVRAGEFGLRLRAARHDAAGRWARAAREFRADPDLLLWLDMNAADPTDALLNHAAPEALPLHRLGGGPLRTAPGRLPGDLALRFENEGDRLTLDLPGEFDALTFAAWVRFHPEDPDELRHRGLLMSDGWGSRGQVHWQAKGRDFRLSFFDKGDGLDQRLPATSTRLLDGGWHLLTSVIDRADGGTVRHYLDGVLVDRRRVEEPLPVLRLGPSTIGGREPTAEPTRTLNGLIDDLLLWSRPLTHAEIRRLYEAGRP